MKCNLLLILLIATISLMCMPPLSTQATAGWQWISPQIPGVDLNGIYALAADDVYVVGDHGYIGHWNGDRWQDMNSGGYDDLYGIWAAAPDDIFVGGGVQDSVLLHWDGVNWRAMALPSPRQYIEIIWGSASNDVFAVDSGGWYRFYNRVIHWDGASWTVMNDCPVTAPSTIWGLNAHEVFAAGDNGVCRWDGASWTAMSDAGTPPTSLWGTAANDLYGSYGGWEYGGSIVHWDGAAWSTMFESNLAFTSIAGAAHDAMYAVGNYGLPDDAYGYIMRWNGSAWSVEETGQFNPPYSSVFCLSSGEAFAAGDYGFVLARERNGWTSLSGLTEVTLSRIWGADANHIFAAGDLGTIAYWDGQTWTTMASGTTEQLTDIWGASADDVFAVTGSGAIIHWDGSAWRRMSYNEPCRLNGLWGSSSNDVYAVGAKFNSNSLILHWDGTTWVEIFCDGEKPLRDIWGAGPDAVYAVSASGLMLHWDGLQLTAMDSGVSANAVWGFSANDVWVVGNYGEGTHWDGVSWTPQGIGGLDLWGAAPDDVYAVGDYGVAHWDGAAWSTMQNLSTAPLHGVWGTAGNNVYVVGERGTILRWDGAYALGVHIEMPTHVTPGDIFSVTGYLDNPGEPMTAVPVFFVLEGTDDCYWFWDDWNFYDPPYHTAIDYHVMDVPTGSTPVTVVPAMPWPSDVPQHSALHFYGAMLNQSMDAILGEMAVVEWDYANY